MKLKNRFFYILPFIVSVFFIYVPTSQSKEVRGVTDDAIKIGVSMDQTGPAASTVVPLTIAIKNYIRHVNETGGIHGRRIKVIIEDDRYSIPAAIAALKKLVYKDKIYALIGPSSASLVNVIWQKILKEKLPTIVAPSVEVAVKPLKKYLFICTDTYTGQIRTLVDYMVKDYGLKEPRIGLVYPDTETGKTDLRAALPRLKKYDLEPVTKEILMPSALEATSQVMTLRRNKVNCILNIGTIPPTTIALLRELRKFGLKVPVFNSYGAMLGEELNRAGEAANQAYSVHAISPWYGEGSGVAQMRKITLKYSPGTEKPCRGTVYTGGWAVAALLVKVLHDAGRNIDEDTFITTIEAINNYDNGGLTSKMSFSSTNHKGGDSAKIFKADPKSGKYVALTGWRKSD
ncbi:MAG: ABC transporter substrate-binding protein [Thermodesulfobacteriota bacterium]|nr:ABC transporter substrate-binding protein [Thermodesulfobacteriota bacterium]